MDLIFQYLKIRDTSTSFLFDYLHFILEVPSLPFLLIDTMDNICHFSGVVNPCHLGNTTLPLDDVESCFQLEVIDLAQCESEDWSYQIGYRSVVVGFSFGEIKLEFPTLVFDIVNDLTSIRLEGV